MVRPLHKTTGMSAVRLPRPLRRLATLAVCTLAAAACDESLTGADGLPIAPADARIVAVTSQQLLAQFGVQIDTPLRVRVLDDEGRPVRSAVVRYAVVAGAGLFSTDRALTNDQGFTEVLFRPLVTGTVIVEARVEGAGNERVQFTIQVFADPNEAASLERLSGSGQTASVGGVLAQPLVVRVLNPDGFPVDSFPVTFTLDQAQGDEAGVADGPGGPFAAEVVVETDANGIARAFARLGTRTGAHAFSATAVTNAGTESVTFTATATPSTLVDALIAVSGQTQTVVIDTLHERNSPDFRGRDPNPFVVRAVDAFGNPVQGVTITWFVSDGGGAVTESTTVTDAAGLSTNLLVNPTAGSNVVVAVAPGADPVSFSVTGEILEAPAEDDGGGGGGGG